MKFTGERFVPGEIDNKDEIAYEHLHRYYAAAGLVGNKNVLDIACGEGYGTALLAAKAASVTGVDIDTTTIEWAQEKYGNSYPQLQFLQGSAAAIPCLGNRFDIVMSFETIEHLDQSTQVLFMNEIKRVLKPGGLLLMSTPDKENYTDRYGHSNPFHLHEFYRDEFADFIKSNFLHTLLFEQGYEVISIISNAATESRASIALHHWQQEAAAANVKRKYIIAAASAVPLPAAVNALSSAVLHTGKDYLAIMDRLVSMNTEIEKLGKWGKELDAGLSKACDENAALHANITKIQTSGLQLQQQLDQKELLLEELQQKIHLLYQDLNSTKERLSDIYSSDGWRWLSKYYRLKGRLLPEDSPRYRKLKKIVNRLRFLKTPATIPSTVVSPASASHATPAVFEPLELTAYAQPAVSIIIPAFNAWEMTYRCIESIINNTQGIAYEVLLADDGSTDATRQCTEKIKNLVHIRAAANLGFLKNCNYAAQYAKGKHIVFLNNDTRVTPHWLQPMVSLAESAADIGMVGAKLIYPDGRLQEAGGIIWKDASGWNYGHHQDPQQPAFNYVKEVDYVSGACILIPSVIWKKAGGFDERYSPAYSEDSDFAFTLRSMGYRVMYQPLTEVVHYEGYSHGNEATLQAGQQGIKSYQAINNRKLRDKWKAVLETAHFANAENVFQARDRTAGKKTILVIDHYVPHYDRDAGSKTTFQYLQLFSSLGFNIKFLGDNFFRHEPYTTTLQQMGIEVLYGPWYRDNWKEWIKDNAAYIDYVYLNRPHISIKYIDFLKNHTHATILYYLHDLHFLREEKQYAVTRDPLLKTSAAKWKETELALFRKAAVVLTPSEDEKILIKSLDPDFNVDTILPYFFTEKAVPVTGFHLRTQLLFVGGFGHAPNLDAVEWFCAEVWPLVLAQLPGAVFTIAGANPPESVLALQSESIVVKGFVSDKDLAALYQKTKLAVIPLRYGAGVKGKTVEAMFHGIPIVSTGFGVEGMPDGWASFLQPVNDAAAFANGIVRLYNNPEALEGLSRQETSYINRHFTQAAALQKMKNILQAEMAAI